jgi:uncharacterized membrane protein YqhA
MTEGKGQFGGKYRYMYYSRYLALFGIAGLFLISVVLYVDTFILALVRVSKLIRIINSDAPQNIKKNLVDFIRIIDLFFVAAAFHLLAVGLYKVVIDPTLEFPKTVQMNDFDDLKAVLIKIICVVLIVVFLENAMEWNSGWEILGLGSAIALVIGVSTWSVKKNDSK